MELRLLGPPAAWHAGAAIPLGGPRQRAVLAVLAMRANETVGASRLIDNVWEAAPATPESNLRTYVTGLRRAFRDAGVDPARLVTQPGGYLITLAPGELDVAEFENLADRGDRALRRADLAEAVECFTSALKLWHGHPLEGLAVGLAARAEIAGWEDRRLTVVERRARALIDLGQHDGQISDLRRLVTLHPYREQLWASLMLALYRADRRAEALEVFAQARRTLASELGTEPGAELRGLHERMLRGGAGLTVAARPEHAAAPAASPPVPRQMPPAVAEFTGRGPELARLDAVRDGRTGGAPAPIVVVDGTAGVGKTSLVVHWAHRVAARYPDGQLYVNLRGFDPAGPVLSSAEAVRGFLDALGVPPERIPPHPHAQVALYRSLLAGRRMLVVLDNARDAEQARPLLPGSPTCLTLVTSRNRLTPLVATDGAHPLTVDLLPPEQARELLTRRLAGGPVGDEPAAIEQIVAACARLPLALCVAAAHARQTGFPLATLAAQLADAGRRLDVLDAGDPASQVRTVFSWSYAALTPAVSRLFRLLGLHGGPDIALPAATSLAGRPADEVRRALTELVRANLLTEPVPGRFRLHDLLREYAMELAAARDARPARRAALHRLLDHLTHTAYRAERLIQPPRDPIQLPLAAPRAGAQPEPLADPGQAMAWFGAEERVLGVAVWQAADAGFDAHTWQLAWALDTFRSRRGQWQEQADTWRAGLRAAGRLGDPVAEAVAHWLLGRAELRLGRYDDAEVHSRHALDLFRAARHRDGQAFTHNSLAQLQMRRGSPEQALDHARQALELFQATGHHRGEGDALNGVGWHHALLGGYHQALHYCGRALPILRRHGDREGEAAAWDSLGYAHHHLGDHAEAAECYRQALALRRWLGDRYHEAATLARLGDSHAAADREAARAAWRQALDILTHLGHQDTDEVRARLERLDAAPDGCA